MKNLLSVLAAAALLAGCAFPQVSLPPPLGKPTAASRGATAGLANDAVTTTEARALSITNAPIPDAAPAGSVDTQAGNAGVGAPERAAINVDQMTIKAFVQFVFGNLLKKTVALDAKIEQRTDLITLRTDTPQSPRQIADTAKLLLQAYGISVTEFESLVRVATADNRSAELPLLRRGRASAETPPALRPVFHLVELEATRSTEVIAWVKLMFGARVEFQDDVNRNAILVSGAPELVTAALDIVRALDQPRMRGRIAKRITPANLSAAELVLRLTELLSAQGYAIAGQIPGQGAAQSASAAIVLVPVTTLNTVFVFTATQAVAEHVARWAAEVDQPPPSSIGAGFFSFPVRYSEAQSLAKTMGDLLSTATAAGGAVAQQGAAPTRATPRVVVNAASNSLIIQGGTPDEHRQWRSLLNELDKPVKSALIEVVVAEVTLGAKEQLGIEWGLVQQRVGNGTVSGGTLGGLGLGSGGLSLSFLNSARDLRGLLNFLGSSSDSKVLSSPKLLTRNAETASIQVGQEVPIVTSQQSTTTTTPATPGTGILQTIQYRSTGVILRVKPVILAGGRLDLEVAQEVSSAAETRTGVSTSPTIATRRVETKLSMRDGGTVMIGGLMSNSSSGGNTGIPGLRDIPGVGALFRAENKSIDKTELIILITAHVLNDDFEAEAITDSFRKSLSPWLSSDADDEAARRLRPPTAGAAGPDTAVLPTLGARPAAEPVLLEKRSDGVPKQADPAVQEAPRPPGARKSAGAGEIARPSASAQPGSSGARPAEPAPPSGIQGRPVTDPKLLEELNRPPKQ